MHENPRWSVAVVDDDADMRSLLRILIDLDDRVEWAGDAADGIAGLQLVRRARPDVVIMDVDMPRLNGIRALAAIRIARLPSKVVLFTSRPPLQRGRAAAADAIVDKDGTITSVIERAVAVCVDGAPHGSAAPTDERASGPAPCR